MKLRFIAGVCLIFTFLLEFCCAQPTNSASLPKIRTVTAFIRLDRASYRTQVEKALVFLRVAKAELTKAGYEVETIRITSQPFPEYTKGLTPEQALAFFHDYDALAQKEGFTPDIGPAMMKDNDDPAQADLLAQIIATTQSINGFILVADDAGIHWKAIQAAARINRYLEEHTTHSEGNFRFASGAFPPAIAPFYPVSYTTGSGHDFAIGMESANIAQQVFSASNKDFTQAGEQLTAALATEARKVEETARRLETQTSWKYQGIDLTPVPLKEISIGAAMESLVQGPIGSPGSLSAAFSITSAVRKVPVKQAGYSGLMLPVLEDSVLAQRWESGVISRDTLMSYSSVCSTGLDAIPLPGDISQRELENIIADMASLAVKWHKPLSARLLPVAGKHAGEMTEFGSPYLVNIRIQK
ncbi:MAG TPA: DUF711 family protein [Candidatus Angelobacter sp.]|jgi:hypothetical protein|nr:DUF711 family protein [Candidatus Angelobacter sp.]